MLFAKLAPEKFPLILLQWKQAIISLLLKIKVNGFQQQHERNWLRKWKKNWLHWQVLNLNFSNQYRCDLMN